MIKNNYNKSDNLDLVIEQLEKSKIEPGIDKDDAYEIIDDLREIRKYCPRYPDEKSVNNLKNVKMNVEGFVSIVKGQIRNSRQIKKDYVDLDHLIDEKIIVVKKKMKKQLTEIKYEIIEGFNIGKAIRNSPIYKAAKRAFNAVVNKLKQIKKQIVEKLKILKKVGKWLMKIKEKLEEALFWAANKISSAIKKLKEMKESVTGKSKEILEKSQVAIREAKLMAKTVRIGTNLKIKYILLKAKGRTVHIGFDEQEKIDSAMELIKKYDPNLISKMMKLGNKMSANVMKEKNEAPSDKADINTNVDIGTGINSNFGNIDVKLDRFTSIENSKREDSKKTIIYILLLFLLSLSIIKIGQKHGLLSKY